jgi:hypothetical protein
MLALPLQDVPSDLPFREPINPAGDYPPPSRAPAGQRRRRELVPIPLTHPPPHSSVGPTEWRSRLPRRSRSSARAAPWTARWTPGGPLHGVPDTPAVQLARRFRRVRAPDTRLDTASADQYLLRTPGQWLAG